MTGTLRSQRGEVVAVVGEVWMGELCAEYGFTYDCWRDEGDERVIELLGPDSPGEYVIRFQRSRLAEEGLQDLTRELVVTITRLGKEYTSGQRTLRGSQEEVPRSGRGHGSARRHDQGDVD